MIVLIITVIRFPDFSFVRQPVLYVFRDSVIRMNQKTWHIFRQKTANNGG